ncbi:MAG: HPr family phosphocarrier protein, partial [Candidatus Methylopumilus sp.]
MLITSIGIINKLGLHARASAKLTQVANQFKSDIWIEKNNKK